YRAPFADDLFSNHNRISTDFLLGARVHPQLKEVQKISLFSNRLLCRWRAGGLCGPVHGRHPSKASPRKLREPADGAPAPAQTEPFRPKRRSLRLNPAGSVWLAFANHREASAGPPLSLWSIGWSARSRSPSDAVSTGASSPLVLEREA